MQLVLLSSYGFRLAAGASEVDAVYGPVCACHGREGAGVSCRSAEKDCKYNYRTGEPHMLATSSDLDGAQKARREEEV